MAITAAGKRVVKVLQDELQKLGDNATMTVAEIAEAGDLKVASVRGSLSKLMKEGYVNSEPVETEEGKKQKRISLTAQGWEANTDATEEVEEG